MRRLFKESKKIATFALAAAMAVTAAFGVAKVAWAEGEAETPIVTNVSFDLADDSVTVVDKQGEAVASTYYFYTTDKVSSKKIPAANKWKRTADGKVSTETISKKKTLYFAKTTTPTYDEVVAVEIPAAPKVKSAKYNAPKNEWTITTTTNAADKFVVISAGDYMSLEDFAGDYMSLEDFKATDENNAPKREGFVNSMYGETVYVAIAPVGTDGNVLKSVDGTSNMVAELKADANTGVYKFPEKAVRGSVYSTSKKVKIGARKAGPSVTIDYANHRIKVADTTEVAIPTNIYTASDFETPINTSTDPDVKVEGKNVYYYFNDAAKLYDVRTKANSKYVASMDTVISVPVTSDFSANASIIGGYQQDATLEIYPAPGENGTSISYQYMVLSSTDYAKVVKKTSESQVEYFDYKAAMEDNIYKKWKTIKYTVDKSGKAKNATAKITNSKGKKDNTLAANSVVLVREAGKTGTPSSKVMIFTIPTESNPYWTSRKIGEDEGNAEKNISISEVKIAEDEAKFEMVVKNGNDKLANSLKDYIKVNNQAPSDVTPEEIKKDDEGTGDVKVTITIPTSLKSNGKDITVSVKAGFIENSNYTYSKKFVKADTIAPTVSGNPDVKWILADDKQSATVKVTVELSENIATKDAEGKITLIENVDLKEYFSKGDSPKDFTALNKATYTKAAGKKKANIVFELTYSLNDAASVEGQIVYAAEKQLYDAAGHKLMFDGDKIVITADSSIKKYDAPSAST